MQSTCPICKAPTAPAFRPFCSKRCADVDLSRWLGGAYAIAGHADTEEDGEGHNSTSDRGTQRTNGGEHPVAEEEAP